MRIEDTDKLRSTQESVQEILDSLAWLGLNWDEGPIYQSSRLSVYQEHAQRLLKKGLAVAARDPEKGSGEAIIYKMPSRKIVVDDMIYGRVEFDSDLLKDQVLIKSDGHPAYNFACVVDDADMRINPVIRGEDHLSNTPKQIAIYEALDLPLPRFAHVPLILGADRSRLSKRHGATSVGSYRQDGYMSKALVNYLMLLGWSAGTDQEIFSLDELVGLFDLNQVSRKGAVFSLEKLQWMNAHYMRQLSDEQLCEAVAPFLATTGLVEQGKSRDRIRAVACLLKERMRLLKDIVDLGACFFQENVTLDEAAAKKFLFKKENGPILARLTEVLKSVEPYEAAGIEKAVRAIIEEFKAKSTPVIQMIRVALTGKSVSAGMFETMVVLGKDVCLTRLEKAKAMLDDESGK